MKFIKASRYNILQSIGPTNLCTVPTTVARHLTTNPVQEDELGFGSVLTLAELRPLLCSKHSGGGLDVESLCDDLGMLPVPLWRPCFLQPVGPLPLLAENGSRRTKSQAMAEEQSG